MRRGNFGNHVSLYVSLKKGGPYKNVVESMCDKNFAELFAICGKVHETPDQPDFSYLRTHPVDPIPQLFHDQGNSSRRNDCSPLFSCSAGNTDENRASQPLFVRNFNIIGT